MSKFFPDYNLPSLEVAHLTVRATLENSSGEPVDGTLSGRIGDVEFHQPARLDAKVSQEITFSPAEYPQLNLHKPRLWWPVDMGPQNLYKLR